jgi:hypothetical protein
MPRSMAAAPKTWILTGSPDDSAAARAAALPPIVPA